MKRKKMRNGRSRKSAEALFGVKHQRLAGGGFFVSGAVRVLVNSGNPGLDCVIDFWQGV